MQPLLIGPLCHSRAGGGCAAGGQSHVGKTSSGSHCPCARLGLALPCSFPGFTNSMGQGTQVLGACTGPWEQGSRPASSLAGEGHDLVSAVLVPPVRWTETQGPRGPLHPHSIMTSERDHWLSATANLGTKPAPQQITQSLWCWLPRRGDGWREGRAHRWHVVTGPAGQCWP